jgi:phosphoribosylaminoimidazole-succinocarboxamide synthase
VPWTWSCYQYEHYFAKIERLPCPVPLDRHFRESGNPVKAHPVDSRFRGNDELIDYKSLNSGFDYLHKTAICSRSAVPFSMGSTKAEGKFIMNDMLGEKEIQHLVEEHLNQTIDAPMIRQIIESGELSQLQTADYYQGKVRANFSGPDLIGAKGIPLRVIIATDQISTHDMVRGAIPFRGQILNNISNTMFNLTAAYLPCAQLYAPQNSTVVISENCVPFMFEMIWRCYMCKSSTETSLYYHYVNLGKREFCGHFLPEGLVADGPLPYMMDTPSTKQSEDGGHDVSVSPGRLYQQGIISPEEYGQVLYMTGSAYRYGQRMLMEKGVIVPDTKFELGKTADGRIVTIDEVLTPDSSRFWLADDYQEKMAAGQSPTSYSKQFGRDIGTVGQPYTDQERFLIGCRYVETYQKLTAQRFVPDRRSPWQRVIEDVQKGLNQLMGN